MKYDELQRLEKFSKRKQKKQSWHRLVICMAVLVAFFTIKTLILPAVALESPKCGLEEHSHSDECYEWITAENSDDVVCNLDTLQTHVHEDSCFDENGNIICGYADFVVHAHEDICYDEEGNLRCELEEIKVHEHDGSCYADVPEDTDSVHSPSDADEIVETEQNQICAKEEIVLHTHTKDCRNEEGVLNCEQLEIREHQHTAECFPGTVETKVLICEIPGHQHTDECLEEPEVLPCGYADFVVHMHDENCYTDDGELWCELPEIEEHKHDDFCYMIMDIIDEDEYHEHTDACYGTVEESDDSDNEEETGTHSPSNATDISVHSPSNAAEVTVHSPSNAKQLVLICGYEDSEDVELETERICELQEAIPHIHDESCWNEEGGLDCGMMEVRSHQHDEQCRQQALNGEMPHCMESIHEHTDDCWDEPLFSPEQQAQIAEITDLIENLPTMDEIKTSVEMDDEDPARMCIVYTLESKDYIDQISNQTIEIHNAYELLSERQKANVENADKLQQMEWLWGKRYVFDYPSLIDDSAFVSELSVISTTTSAEGTDVPDEAMTAYNKNRVIYEFTAVTQSYEDMLFDEGRMKLEFVLPLPEEKAIFNLDEMTWIDHTDGYAPTLTMEKREVQGQEVECQVLTAYQYFLAGEVGNSVIPGEMSETVIVDVVDMEHGETVSVQISAAMEHAEWDGICGTHGIEEKLTVESDEVTVVDAVIVAKQLATYKYYLTEIEKLEAIGELDEDQKEAAEELMSQMAESLNKEELSEANYQELSLRLIKLVYGGTEYIAEYVSGTNWMRLRDSGWFEEYSTADVQDSVTSQTLRTSLRPQMYRLLRSSTLIEETQNNEVEAASEIKTQVAPSTVQIDRTGGSNTSEDGKVSVSKTIAGTDLENVFDITLTVTTEEKIEELYKEPDMAVVIVMDISNTMKENFGDGPTDTKYKAAMDSAEQFVDLFSENNNGVSKIGYVAFNTNAHEICEMQTCNGEAAATAFKNEMRQDTGIIINPDDYKESRSRYTNIEAGLIMAKDMLAETSNKNKYVIFLSDGLPTTYVKSGYTGYEPYSDSVENRNIGKDGYFYDNINKLALEYGCSYSDKGALRAQNAAAELKDSGVTIFSIGAGLNCFGGTYTTSGLSGVGLIKDQLMRAEKKKVAVIDTERTNSSSMYIGDLDDDRAFEKWLGNAIGSGYDGYYFDALDSEGLEKAYNSIFEKIRELNASASQADWVTKDPIPALGGSGEAVEFIGFYNKTPALVIDDLIGKYEVDGENTASFDNDSYAISWDLKQSGYQTMIVDDTTTYYYKLVYRVRLRNEATDFVEGSIYPTNDITSLTYNLFENKNGDITISDDKTLKFPIPAVHGYLAELKFKKTDSRGNALAGAEFTLTHDTKSCNICRGDGSTAVSIEKISSDSDADGVVTFTGIPSGHDYNLTETKVPIGYQASFDTYDVNVAYDVLTVSVKASDGTEKTWNGNIVNKTYYELPKTGGNGTTLYAFGGLFMILNALIGCFMYNKKRN